jgi:hypothetical protein
MPTPRRRRPATGPSRIVAVTVLTASALGVLGALAGCDDTSADEARSSTASASAGPASSAPSSTAATPSIAPSPSASAVTTSPAATPPGGDLASRLLPGDAVPALNDGTAWQSGSTTSREPAALFGTCQKFAMTSVGASRVAYRSFAPLARSENSAEQLVAQFPDATTARRAWSVLQSWHADCKSRLRAFRDPQVDPVRDVAVDGGQGAWYLLVYGPAPQDPDAGVFDAQGMALVGDRITMLEIKSIGQDYDYPPGQEPMAAAVRAAAGALG